MARYFVSIKENKPDYATKEIEKPKKIRKRKEINIKINELNIKIKELITLINQLWK